MIAATHKPFAAARPPRQSRKRPHNDGIQQARSSPPIPAASGRSCSEAPEPVLGQPIERADIMLPADLIQGGEVVILLLKPSPWYILLGCLGSLAALAAAAASLILLQRGLDLALFDRAELLTLAIVLGGVRIGWQFFQWLSRTYVLTDRRVIRVKGVFHVEVFQAPLRRIQHTELLFSVRERFFGLGTISFATAGSAYPEAYWVMLRRPLAVHRRIVETMHRYGGGGRSQP